MSRICEDCHCHTIECDSFVFHDDIIDADIVVPGVHDRCPSCNQEWIPGEIFLDKRLEERQKAIERWIFNGVHSFDELNGLFVGEQEAISLIKDSDCLSEDDVDFTILHLRQKCFHFDLLGNVFYLKSSVRNASHGLAGEWPLKEGFKMEENADD